MRAKENDHLKHHKEKISLMPLKESPQAVSLESVSRSSLPHTLCTHERPFVLVACFAFTKNPAGSGFISIN